jgi:hypothetical protein
MFRLSSLPGQGTLIEEGSSSIVEQQSKSYAWARMSDWTHTRHSIRNTNLPLLGGPAYHGPSPSAEVLVPGPWHLGLSAECYVPALGTQL